MRFINIAGYKFVPLQRLPEFRARLVECCRELGVRGTILLSPEGINIVVAGCDPAVTRFKDFVHADSRVAGLRFKESVSSFQPFKRMLVKIKKEIITLRVSGVDPAARRAPSVTPAELRRWLDEGRDLVLLDTRNAFEVDTGTFHGAMHLNLKSFGEFPRAADRIEEAFKAKTVIAFCTGGRLRHVSRRPDCGNSRISPGMPQWNAALCAPTRPEATLAESGARCEKAVPLLIQKGFRDVFQLEGGILQYFEECGNAHFKGRCFVFDQRTALDGNLSPELADAQ